MPLDVAERSPLSVRRVCAPHTDIRRKRLNLRYMRSQKSKLQLLQFAVPVANASGVS